MSRRYAIKRKEWADKVEQWRQSGKNAKQWCQENQTVYARFITWRKRLKLNPKNSQNQPLRRTVQTPFVELKDKTKESPGILLECAGVKIHLSKDFDVALLKKCINVLQGASC